MDAICVQWWNERWNIFVYRALQHIALSRNLQSDILHSYWSNKIWGANNVKWSPQFSTGLINWIHEISNICDYKTLCTVMLLLDCFKINTFHQISQLTCTQISKEYLMPTPPPPQQVSFYVIFSQKSQHFIQFYRHAHYCLLYSNRNFKMYVVMRGVFAYHLIKSLFAPNGIHPIRPQRNDPPCTRWSYHERSMCNNNN